MQHRFTLAGLVTLSIAAGFGVALLVTRPKLQSHSESYNPGTNSTTFRESPLSPQEGPPAQAFLESTANILELPKASGDFVGYWAGYIHSSIQRVSPNLRGKSPDRVSVIFGRDGNTIFITSKLYSSPEQKLLRRPAARVVRGRTAIIEYQSFDRELYYSHRHRFELKAADTISYRSTVDVYERSSRALVGIVTERATLRRLRTLREQLAFARPSRIEVPRADIWASADVGAN
ncbi:MAG: hypothetical protein JO166_20950 [Deltaproteobacteria bacterium]|nr:hypothetical protein [Deltaproteobacteria bacterium]